MSEELRPERAPVRLGKVENTVRRKPILQCVRLSLAVLCSFVLAPGTPGLYAQPARQDAGSQAQPSPKIPNDQLDSLVAPIALYPDPLLAQVLAASTYPLEIIQLQQWLAQNPGLKDQALADAVQKQDWDPSIQALASLPDVVKRLADDIKWTTDLGNAFLAQQGDVMDAVQRMRAKAQGQGNLKSNQQQTVQTQTVENKQVIVIQQASPQVVYVPSYNPVVVYGPPIYPYPPITYPPPGAFVAGMAIGFGVGVAMGAAMGGGWGYGCHWGGNNNVTINNNNNYIRNSNSNINNRNVSNRGGNTWQHNPQYRGGTPYPNKATANKYGGTTANSSLASRQASARQNVSQERASGQQFGGPNRGGASSAGAGGRGNVGGENRAGGGQGSFGGGGGGDRVGNHSVSSGGGSSGSRGGGFGGGSGGFEGSSARTSSSRGASSMGGGGSRGGGGRRR